MQLMFMLNSVLSSSMRVISILCLPTLKIKEGGTACCILARKSSQRSLLGLKRGLLILFIDHVNNYWGEPEQAPH